MMSTIKMPDFKISITFSGVYRKSHVKPICEALLGLGFKKDDIFLDEWHPELINGVNGADKLQSIYNEHSDCVVVLLSPDYMEKNWTGGIEWPAIKELIHSQKGEKITLLSVGIVDIKSIPGLFPFSAIYQSIDSWSAEEIAKFIKRRYNLLYALGENPVFSSATIKFDNTIFDDCNDMRHLLSKATSVICQITQTDYNQIALCVKQDFSTRLLVCAHNIANHKQIYRIVNTKGLMYKAFSSGKSQIVGDINKCSDYFSAEPTTVSETVIPIINSNNRQVIGIINSESEGKDYYSEGIANDLQRIADYLAISLIRVGYKTDLPLDSVPYVHLIPCEQSPRDDEYIAVYYSLNADKDPAALPILYIPSGYKKLQS